ncbi:hypothetical protein KKB40_05185 [Patescibacteria group bacterium]|nr:hypothetical protein [Patescibacteria group bacterium]
MKKNKTVSLVKKALIITNLLEFSLLGMVGLATLFSYPDGFVGASAPTTKRNVYESLIEVVIGGCFLFLSFLNLKHAKFISKIFLIKTPVYFYILIKLWLSFSFSSQDLVLNIIMLSFALFVNLYYLFSITLIISNYSLANDWPKMNKKSKKRLYL